MANTAAILAELLKVKADINYYTQQQIYWSNKYDANAAKLANQNKYYEGWESAFDSAIDNTKELTAGYVVVHENNTNELLADQYAHEKVSQYNEELSLELADLDLEYDTMKTMCDTLLETLRAQKDSLTQAASTAAQDTGLLGS